MAKARRILKLNRQKKKLLGVCAGVADYLEVEAWSVRLVFMVSVIFGAWFLIPLYFIAWFLLDEEKPGKFRDSIAQYSTFKHLKNVDFRKKVYRNRKDGKFLGVCAGIADYLEVNVFVVRMVTLVIFFLSGSIAVLAYFGAYFILEEKPEQSNFYQSNPEYTSAKEKLNEDKYSARGEFKNCARKFSTLQDRLARMEAYVTSKQFKLYREFKSL